MMRISFDAVKVEYNEAIDEKTVQLTLDEDDT